MLVRGYSFWKNKPLAAKEDDVSRKPIGCLKKYQQASTTLTVKTRKIVTKNEFSMTAPLPAPKPTKGIANKNGTGQNPRAIKPHFLLERSYSTSAPYA